MRCLLTFLENLQLKLMNEENKMLQSTQRDNQKKKVDYIHQKIMEEIALEEDKISAETRQTLQTIQAN